MDNDERLLGRPNKPRRDWLSLLGLRGKTLWDWTGLLVVPLFIAGATLVFSVFELQREERRVQVQQQIEADRAQQSVLQSYIQDMTELLLDKGLVTSKRDSIIRQVARANTLSVIQRLDSGRNRILLGFLSDSNLLSSGSVALLSGTDLSGVDLSNANLSDADLSGADLREAILSGADLSGTDLSNANLSGVNLNDIELSFANLSGADLSRANLSSATLVIANLSGANLSDANLSNITLIGINPSGVDPSDIFGANLSFADLSGANLSGADLSDANLSDANLIDANLIDANLSGADLSSAYLNNANLSSAHLNSADLSGADLSNAEGWTNEQLARAGSLVGATMPDRRVMTEAVWEEFKRRYRQ